MLNKMNPIRLRLEHVAKGNVSEKLIEISITGFIYGSAELIVKTVILDIGSVFDANVASVIGKIAGVTAGFIFYNIVSDDERRESAIIAVSMAAIMMTLLYGIMLIVEFIKSIPAVDSSILKVAQFSFIAIVLTLVIYYYTLYSILNIIDISLLLFVPEKYRKKRLGVMSLVAVALISIAYLCNKYYKEIIHSYIFVSLAVIGIPSATFYYLFYEENSDKWDSRYRKFRNTRVVKIIIVYSRWLSLKASIEFRDRNGSGKNAPGRVYLRRNIRNIKRRHLIFIRTFRRVDACIANGILWIRITIYAMAIFCIFIPG